MWQHVDSSMRRDWHAGDGDQGSADRSWWLSLHDVWTSRSPSAVLNVSAYTLECQHNPELAPTSKQ